MKMQVFHCDPARDELRRCDCNYKKGQCHCSDNDCDWEPETTKCKCVFEDTYQNHLNSLAKMLGCELRQYGPNTPGMMYVEFGYVEGPTIVPGYAGSYRNSQDRYVTCLHELGHFYHGHTQGRPYEKYQDRVPYTSKDIEKIEDYQFYFNNGVLKSEAQAWEFALDNMIDEPNEETKNFMVNRCIGSYFSHAQMVGFNTPGQTLGNGDRAYVTFAYGEPDSYYYRVVARMKGE